MPRGVNNTGNCKTSHLRLEPDSFFESQMRRATGLRMNRFNLNRRIFVAVATVSACLSFPVGAAAAPDLALLMKANDPGGVARDRLYTFDPLSGAFKHLIVGNDRFLALQSFAWQPSGESIAFVSTVAVSGNGTATAPRAELFTVRRGGGGLRRLARAETIGAPAFSPDGKRIALVASFKRRSGAGCARGGHAVAVISVARPSLRRISACFTSRLARSRVAFIGKNRSVAAVPDRRRLVRLAASGAHRAKTRPPVIHQAAVGDRIAIGSYLPGTKSFWLHLDTGDTELLRIGARRPTLLPGDTFDVAPSGRAAVGNCAALPEDGLCGLSVRTRKRTRISSPFEPDLSRNSLEFGFSFDAQSRRIVSFGHPTFGLDGLPSGTRICVRPTLKAPTACHDLPAGHSVADKNTGVALWRPTT